MKRPTFSEGAVVALVASLGATVLYHTLPLILPGMWVLQALTALVALGYVLYLLARSPVRFGRISALALWFLVTAVTLSLGPSLALHMLVQVGLVWLIRSLYFYTSVLSALADLGISALALSAAVWAADQTGSIFLSVWSLLLVQALFVTLPAKLRRGKQHTRPRREAEDRFDRAHRVAESALRRLCKP